jgi:hypothetical protein
MVILWSSMFEQRWSAQYNDIGLIFDWVGCIFLHYTVPGDQVTWVEACKENITTVEQLNNMKWLMFCLGGSCLLVAVVYLPNMKIPYIGQILWFLDVRNYSGFSNYVSGASSGPSSTWGSSKSQGADATSKASKMSVANSRASSMGASSVSRSSASSSSQSTAEGDDEEEDEIDAMMKLCQVDVVAEEFAKESKAVVPVDDVAMAECEEVPQDAKE